MKTPTVLVVVAAIAGASMGLADTGRDTIDRLLAKNPSGKGVTPPGSLGDDSHAGFFTGVESGAFWLQDESKSLGPMRADLNFNTGWGITVPIGYDFGNGFSASFSGGYFRANLDSLQLRLEDIRRTFKVNGDAVMVPLMINGSYKVNLLGKLSLYAGVGVGAIYTETNVDSVDHNLFSVTDHSWDLGIQAFTGLSYDVCAFSSLRIGYRYTHVFRSDPDHNGHSLELGVLVRF